MLKHYKYLTMYVCKYCKKEYLNVDKFKDHKLTVHLQQVRNDLKAKQLAKLNGTSTSPAHVSGSKSRVPDADHIANPPKSVKHDQVKRDSAVTARKGPKGGSEVDSEASVVTVETKAGHARVTGPKSLSCSYCHMKLSSTSNLRYHENIHTGVKPYRCNKCHAGFAHPTSRHRHQLICSSKKQTAKLISTSKRTIAKPGSTFKKPLSKPVTTFKQPLAKSTVDIRRKLHNIEIKRVSFIEAKRALGAAVDINSFSKLNLQQQSPPTQKAARINRTGIRRVRSNPVKVNAATVLQTKKVKSGTPALDTTPERMGPTSKYVTRITVDSKSRYSCDFCGQHYDRDKYARFHTSVHTGVYLFNCDFCGKGFNFLDKFLIHRRGHTGEKPYQCSVCPLAFTEERRQRIHIEGHGNRAKQHTCQKCGKWYSARRNRDAHQRLCEM